MSFFVACFASNVSFAGWVLWRLMTQCVLSAAATGGHDEMRGEHRSQLSLSLAGDGCLRLWTLPEGHRVVHPQGEVRQGPPLWILSRLTGFCAPAPLHWSILCFGYMFTLICTEPSLMSTLSRHKQTGFPSSSASSASVYLLLEVILRHALEVNV